MSSYLAGQLIGSVMHAPGELTAKPEPEQPLTTPGAKSGSLFAPESEATAEPTTPAPPQKGLFDEALKTISKAVTPGEEPAAVPVPVPVTEDLAADLEAALKGNQAKPTEPEKETIVSKPAPVEQERMTAAQVGDAQIYLGGIKTVAEPRKVRDEW
jgi:hypothetical protein